MWCCRRSAESAVRGWVGFPAYPRTSPSSGGDVDLLGHEHVEQVVIELALPCFVVEDVERGRCRHRSLVGTVLGGQGVEDVGDRHHPRLKRNLVARQAARVARSVELLVMAI